MKKGQVPTEYKKYVGPKDKKYTSRSNFLKNRGLKEEYENRYQGEGPAYVPLAKKNHLKKMKEKVDDLEGQFKQALDFSETDKRNLPLGRKRPITTTGKHTFFLLSQIIGGNTKKSVIKYSKTNNDIDVDDENDVNQSEMDDLDSVIGIMNTKLKSKPGSNNSSDKKYKFDPKTIEHEAKRLFTQESSEKKSPPKEVDYLDYEENMDNLKKIMDEQSKFDYLANDLDS